MSRVHHRGFGLSDAPPAAEFGYTFDALTGLTAGLLGLLGLDRYAIYVQDYGAPVGWRLAVWGAGTRSSARPAPRPSPRTPPTPRSTCSTAGTS